MAQTANTYGNYFGDARTTRYRSPANIALAKGILIGTNASGKAVFAQTDATAVVAEAITAESCAAGEYPTVYMEGSIGDVLVNANTNANVALKTGLAAQVGKPINSTAVAGTRILAVAVEYIAAGNLGKCKIVNYQRNA